MLNSGDHFEHDGKWFEFKTEPDEDHGAPWLNEDGHGVIEWRTPRRNAYGYAAKAPGEVILLNTGVKTWFYNVPASIKQAIADGWGWLPGELKMRQNSAGDWVAECEGMAATAPDKNKAISDLYAINRARFTAKAYAAEAVKRDLARMLAWANDEWHYVGVIVTMLDDDNETPRPLYSDALWGIESDCGEYIEETAHELAGEIIARMA